MSIKEQWSNHINDDKVNLNSLGMEWKNFMKECLMKTEVITNSVLDEQSESRYSDNPNLVMDIRHAMVKNHSIITVIPPSKELLRSNNMKLLREERLKKLIKQKTERTIRNEIEKLKTALESYRNENAKQLEETTKEKIKDQIRVLKFSKKFSSSLKHSKLQFESQYMAKKHNFWKDANNTSSVPNKSALNESLQLNEKAECFSEPMFYERKGSIASFENENEANNLKCFNLTCDEGKYLIMQKFFDRNYSENKLNGQIITENGQLPMEKRNQTESPKKNVKNENTFKKEKNNVNDALNTNELKQQFCDAKELSSKKEQNIYSPKSNYEDKTLRKKEEIFDTNKSYFCEEHQIKSLSNFEDEILKKKNEDLILKFSRRYLVRAWTAWKNFTQTRTKRKLEKKKFEKKIENFLTKLEESKKFRNELKKKQNVELTNDNSQKNFSGCQIIKTKIERKLALISNKKDKSKTKKSEKEEKLDAIIQEVKASQNEAYQHLLKIEKQNGHGMERVKVLKSLVNVIDDSPAKVYPAPQFLLRMKKRTEERKYRWNEIQDRRKKLEEQKENEKKLKEEQELKAKELENKKRIEEMRRKRIREREKKKRQLKEKEKLALQMIFAENHHQKTLLKSKFKLWRKLVALRQFQEKKAEDFYEHKLLQYTLTELVKNSRESQKFKQTKAEKFYEKKLRQYCFRIWMEHCEERYKQLQVAVDWNDLRVTETFFKHWLDFTLQENLRYLQLQKLADLNYAKKLKIKFFKLFKNYPNVKKCELEKEERKRFWRQKVLEILPDYCPAELFE